MRSLLTLSILALSFVASTSRAANVPVACEGNAESFLEGYQDLQDRYDREGFMTTECSVSPRGSAVVCEVGASKGDGAAIDTYMVVMNKKCTRLFRIVLTGEE
jgi:hypothetical protein